MGIAEGRERDVDVEHRSFDLERRGRRADRRKARPLAKRGEVAGEHLADAHDRIDFVGAVDERHVLRGLGEHGEVLDELAAVEGDVGGADLGPHEVELGELVHERRALAQVLQRAGPARARAKVERLGDAAARGKPERLVGADQGVVGRRGAGHREGARAPGDGPFDELAGQVHDAGSVVDLSAARRQQRQHARAGQAYADRREQVDGLVCDAALLVLGEPRGPCLHKPHTFPRAAVRALVRGLGGGPGRRATGPFAGHDVTTPGRCQPETFRSNDNQHNLLSLQRACLNWRCESARMTHSL